MTRRLAAVVVAAAAVLAPVAAPAASSCETRACNERVAAKRCSNDRPKWCVERAIFRRDYQGTWRAAWMRRVPGCESGWNPYARNPSGSSGLYQFLPSTWATTPYRRRSIWKAKWQALAAGWMLHVGRAPGEWSCK